MKKVKFLVFFMLLTFITTCTVFADTLKVGSEGQAVSGVQTQLKKMGYFKGEITGYFGSETKAAVKKFQVKKGFIATGSVDEKLSKLIVGTSSTAKTGTAVSLATLKQTQADLKQLGLYSGKIDGITGTKFASAVKAYQKKHKLKVTGKLDTTTLKGITADSKKIAAAKAKAVSAKKAAAAKTTTAKAVTAKVAATKVTAVKSAAPKAVVTKAAAAAVAQTESALMPGDPANVDMWQETPETIENNETDQDEPNDGKIEVLDWWTKARYVFKVGTVASVIDVQSGKSFKIVRTYGANHADSETLTAKDTAVMKEIWGGEWNWDRRPVILEINGRYLAASMAGMPHAGLDELPANRTVASRSGGFGRGANLDKIKDNNMSGHFDVHFLNSRTHGTNRVDPKHQAAIKEAAKVKIEDGKIVK